MNEELGLGENAESQEDVFQRSQDQIKQKSFVKAKQDLSQPKSWENARKQKVYKEPVYVLPKDLIEDPSKDQVLVDYITKFEKRLSYFDHPGIMVEGRITTTLKENMVTKRKVGKDAPKGPQHSGYYFFMQAKPDSPAIMLENGKETVAGGIFKVFVASEPRNFRRGALCKALGAVKLSRDREQSHDTYRCSIEEAQEKKIEEDPELQNPEKAAKKSAKSSSLLGDDDWF